MVEQCRHQVYSFAYYSLGSRDEAEDVTQEVFLALMDGASGFDPASGSFSSYLYGIARNHVLRRMAREKLFMQISIDISEESKNFHAGPDSRPDALHDLTSRERLHALRCAVAALPMRYREVVILCELQELNYAEAAQVIGCPEGTIRSRLHRARILLLKKLQEGALKDPHTPRIVTARCLP